MDVVVPYSKLHEFCEVDNLSAISGGKNVTAVRFNGELYIPNGCGSSGAKGYLWCWAHRFIALDDYVGEIQAMEYDDHQAAISEGKRERGYENIIVRYNGSKVVMVGERISFIPSHSRDEVGQIKLF